VRAAPRCLPPLPLLPHAPLTHARPSHARTLAAAGPTADDTPELLAARELETAILRQWIAEFAEERAAAKARLAAL